MRTISLVNRLKWSFSGNMNPHALVLGDVDNDGYNEFVIGNLSGDLAIFKGECSQGLPTFMCRGLGTITCIAVGDVRNCGKNSVVCINAEGHAHIFDIPRQHPVEHEHHSTSGEDYLRQQQQARRGSDTSSIRAFRRLMATTTGESEQIARDAAAGLPGYRTSSIYDLQKPNLTLKVPVNVNKILIADVDGDALNEIILARTDRILHAFQLASSPDANNNFQVDHPQVPRGFHTPSLASASTSASSSNTHKQQPQAPAASLQSSLSNLSSSNKDKSKLPPSTSKRSSLVDSKDKPNVLRKGMAWSTSSKQKSATDSTSQQKQKQDQQQQQQQQPNPEKLYLLDKDIWVFDGQITSLSTTVHPTKPNEPVLLVAQPGNTFTIIDCEGNRFNPDMTPQYSQRAQYTQYHKQKRRSTYGQPAPATSSDTRSDDAKKNEDNLDLTPKAREGAFSNFKRATRTIRTFLQRGSMREEETSVVPPELEADNLVVSCEEGGTSKIRDISGNEFKRSNFVVPNWPIVDGDDIIGNEENGAVATEIVIGQRHPTVMDPETGEMCKEDDGSQVGMLSMDGKFTIYDLRKQEVSQHDLFVTHKLFSLATLDISYNSSMHNTPGIATPISLHPSYHSPNGSPHLRFPSPSTAAESYSSFNGNNTNNYNNSNNHRNEPMSSGASPALSSSSRLSRVTTNASNANPDIKHAEGHPADQRSSRGELDVATDTLERVPSKTEESFKEDISRRESLNSDLESDLEDEGDLWSEEDESETDEEAYPDSDLFVACAWNGVTYLIDWSKRLMDDEDHDAKNKIKFQLVKFAFEGRVCAFTAGLYAVTPGRHVPCLFYVDFEDQIFVYYDVRVSPGPVSGFIDSIDDDIEEALERIVGIESEVKALVHNNVSTTSTQGESDTDNELIDLGDGWKGVLDGNVMFDDGSLSKQRRRESTEEMLEDILDTEQLDLADFIHECLYDSEDLRDRLEEQIMALEKKRVSHHHHHQLTDGMDLRRLSDLNITLEPSRDSGDSASETDGLMRPPSQASSFSNSSLHNREEEFED